MADLPTILVVEDDSTIVELIRVVLADEGYQVRVASNGDEALTAAGGDVALVVMDMYVPGVSGKPLADRLRAMLGPDTPILVVSASNVDDEALGLGAYEYLPKPFDIDELVRAVRRGLGPVTQ